MQFKKLLLAPFVFAMIFLMISVVFSSPAVHNSGLPKTDEIWYKAYPGAAPDVIVDEFIGGVTDWIGGPGRKDLYDRVIAAGHKVSEMSPMAEFAFMPINCRDYKVTSGESNFPLNDSNFRIALSYIYGVDRKQEDVYAYVQAPWEFAIGNPVPPAQEPWYDESIQMPDTDFDMAWSILQAAGYYVNPDDNWLHWTDGVRDIKVRNMEVWYSTGALYWERGPGVGFVRAFNEFISYIGAVGPTMTLKPQTFYTLVTQLMIYRDYDFICIGLTGLGRYVDWLYDLLHSSTDVPWGWNFCGIHDPDFDTWTEIILTSLNVDEIIEAASNVQYKFVYELLPWFPMSAGLEFSTVARDDRGELMNLIPMPNYGSQNDWSWMTLHWKGDWPGGSYSRALGDEPHTLNPWNEDTLYGWQLLDRAIVGLLGVEPYTLTNIPFVATYYEVEPWVSIPELGIENGAMVTFYLRQDVLWHDLRPVTAYDCVNNMRLMREYKPGRYSSVWSMLVYEEADGPYKFTTYHSSPSLYWADYVAGTALMAPKHVMDAVEELYGGILVEWEKPYEKPYSDLGLGDPPAKYSFMKQIVGCGPYIFDSYDFSLASGHVVKFDEFFVSAPVIGGVVGEWRIDPDSAYTYKVLVENLAAKEDSAEGELANATVNVKVYLDGELQTEVDGIFLTPFNYTYLGPYTTDPFLAGSYGEHTITVEVYDAETGTLWHTYNHKFYVVPREDVSTYAGDNPDCFIDVMDLLRAAMAYGSYPGSLRWDPPCDVDDNFFVDVMDLLAIAMKYGWSAPG